VRLRISRRRFLFGAAIACGAILIVTELYFISASVRMVFINGAEVVGADSYLAGMLTDRDLQVRSEANEALVRRGARAVPALVAKLSDPDPGKRRAAASTLAKIGPAASDGIPALLRVAVEDADENVLETSGQALGVVARDHPSIVLELLGMMESPSDSKRLAATRAAARLDDARAVPLLIHSLKHSNPKVREEAAESLGELKAKAVAAIPALLESVDDPSAEVRSEANQAIAKIVNKAGPNAIDPVLMAKAKAVLEKAVIAPPKPMPDDDDP
jgi:HEAT repeat protein